ncbi:maleylpyruvate isomerase family mycothiol-dependent enzyme [Streptomyces decoyicus]
MDEMCEGGQRGRDRSIDRGAARPAADLREELRLVQRALEETWGRLAPEDWRRPVRFRNATVLDTALARWREAEIHAVDLAVGYRPRDWSLSFALHALDFLAARAPAGVQLALRATDHAFAQSLGTGSPVEVRGAVRDLAAWMAGRGVDGPLHTSARALPELGPWPPDPADWQPGEPVRNGQPRRTGVPVLCRFPGPHGVSVRVMLPSLPPRHARFRSRSVTVRRGAGSRRCRSLPTRRSRPGGRC